MTQEKVNSQKQGEEQAQQPQISVNRIYLKDVSFESPRSPDIFQKDWKPEMQLDIQTTSSHVGGDLHEVVVFVTATVKSEGELAFLVEVKQAGVFTIKSLQDEQLRFVVGTFCPTLLYPYARESVSSLVQKGGFPQLLLAPVNFEALYAQHVKQQQEKAVEKEVAADK